MSQPHPSGSHLAAELLGQKLPESYLRDVELLDAACCEYFRTHGEAFFAFNWPDRRAKIVAPLRFLLLLADNTETRNFIQWIDERTQSRCTVVQLRALFEARGYVRYLDRGNAS